MKSRVMRVGIVGASTLMGRELAEVLQESELGASPLVLLDEGAVSGQMTAVAEEAALIAPIEAASFAGLDLCFFAGSAAETRKHRQAAARAGASLVDLTHALAGEAGVVVRAPWVDQALGGSKGFGPDLATVAVMAAHPVAVVLALMAARVAGLGLTGVAATVLEPASERGKDGMDEMHRQTVSLLSFQSVPRAEYDAQVAFNLLPELGPEAKVMMAEVTRRIRSEYAAAGGARALPELMLQMVHAPVFHGYGFSVLLDFDGIVTSTEIERALSGEHVDVVSDDSDPPSNLSAAGQADVLVRVAAGAHRRMWVWMAADNLRLNAHHAIACALELTSLRAQGAVQ